MTNFQAVIEAWDADGRTGGKHIHPLDPDSAEFWALGEQQAQQVREYAPPGARVLDFGAGIGRLTIPIARMCAMNYHVTAVDSSASMLTTLGERAADRRVSEDQLTIIQSDGSDLTEHIPAGSIDVVVARAVLIHHGYADVARLVRTLADVLRDGGYFIADWPTGEPGERRDWVDVTRWHPHHRLSVALLAGLEPVDVAAEASVWRRRER